VPENELNTGIIIFKYSATAGRQYHGCSALTVLLGGIDRVSYQLKSRKGTPSYFIKVYFWPKFPGYLPWVNLIIQLLSIRSKKA
jgi:hypothetical protein